MSENDYKTAGVSMSPAVLKKYDKKEKNLLTAAYLYAKFIKYAAQRGISSGNGHHIWRVMIIGGAICTQLLQQVVNSTK